MVPSKMSSSYCFLHKAIERAKELNELHVAFLHPKSGFLPPSCMPDLPVEFKQWQDAALQLPNVCRSDEWKSFNEHVCSIPFSIDHLDNRFLHTANLCIGSIAHSLVNIANIPLPDQVKGPWLQISQRLRKPTASLSYFDLSMYNIRYDTSKFSLSTLPNDFDVLHPLVSLTGTATERNFWKGTYLVEHMGRHLPQIVAYTQHYVVNDNPHHVASLLRSLLQTIQEMTTAFKSIDSREFSKRMVGQVEFNISVDATAHAIVPGEKTASGSQSLLIHLLDAFFSRKSYDTPFGRLLQKEYKWFPRLHVEFLMTVRDTCVLSYIQSLEEGSLQTELLVLYFQALDSFSGEYGFLSHHSRKLFGILGIGSKVFRIQSTSGLKFLGWKEQNHFRVYDAMYDARMERMEQLTTAYSSSEISKLPMLIDSKLDGHKLRLKLSHGVYYQPGDVVSLLPENRKSVIDRLMEIWSLDRSSSVTIRSPQWKQAIRDWNIAGFKLTVLQDGSVKMSTYDFLRIADIKSLISNMLGWALISHSSMSLSSSADFSTFEIENMVDPMKPRYFSISSNMDSPADCVELYVGNVIIQHENETKALRRSLSPRDIFSEQFSDAHDFKKHTDNIAFVPNTQGVFSSLVQNCRNGKTVRWKIVPQLHFRLPENKDTPIIMFSLGKGIVPFISFLRSLTGQENAWLIAGVRSPEHLLYAEEIWDAACLRNVLKLSVACSQAELEYSEKSSLSKLCFEKGEKMRIQTLFQRNDVLKHLWEMLQLGAHVYCCGKPDLGALVNEIISRAALRFGKKVLQSTFRHTREDVFLQSQKFPFILASENRLHYSLFDSTPGTTMQRKFLTSEVARHRHETSAFTIYKGNVYDLTNYLQLHPGGARLLLDFAGRDMTESFDKVHGFGTLTEQSILESYRIGKLDAFEEASETIRKLKTNWSEPFLFTMLEHRSVLNLNVNQFPTLEVRAEFEDFKTQQDSLRGMQTVFKRFLEHIEGDASNDMLHTFDEKLLKQIDSHPDYLNTLRNSDILKVREKLRFSRSSVVERYSKIGGQSDIGIDTLLVMAKKFMDDIVELAIRVEEIVEIALVESSKGVESIDLLNNIFSAIKREVVSGVEACYDNECFTGFERLEKDGTLVLH